MLKVSKQRLLVFLVVVLVVLVVFLHRHYGQYLQESTYPRLLGLMNAEDSVASQDRTYSNQSQSRTSITSSNSSWAMTEGGRSLTIQDTNPGCTHKRLPYYKPKRAPTVYHHPPLVHYVKFGKSTLSYMDYMAMLSAYKFLKPERIIVHSNGNIHGEYWDRTQKWSGTSVVVNKVARVSHLGGKHVHWVQHEADYMKLYQMYMHGGVTSDFDVLVINGTKLKEQQRVSECVLSLEGDIVSNGFNSCVKNSPLIKRILDGYKTNYKPHLWLYNCALLPTDILQDKRSDTCYNVYMDDTICIYPNVGQARKWWLSPKGVDWKKKTAAHYFVKTGYPSNEKILKADHSLAEVLRHVNDS